MRDLLFGDVFVSVWHGILCFGCFDELNWKKCHSGMHSSLFCMVFCVLATPMSLAEKYGVADRARSLLLSSVKSCGDEKIDRGLMQATAKELGQGIIKGPRGRPPRFLQAPLSHDALECCRKRRSDQ